MKLRLLTACFVLLSFIGFGQSIADLQKKKHDAAREIQTTTRLLSEVRESQKASLNRLQLLNNQITQRNTIISSIDSEIRLYNQFIANNQMVVDMLDSDIKQIKKEYSELIRSAYRNRNAYDQLLFLLSAENFNQAYRRYIYLKQYTDYRKNQAKIISSIQEVLSEKTIKLEELKRTKQQLVNETRKEAQQLAGEKSQKDRELQKLKKEQSTLRQKLEQQRKVEQQLENEIQRIIAEEAGKTETEPGAGFALTPEQKLIGESFEQNKKRLPWPVERGIITERFGIHQHPVLSNVQIRNNGININTEAGAKVRAVFNGEVSRVFGITGGNTAVIIRHGKYLSVYSNLREASVKKGDRIKTKQEIGTVYTDTDDGNKSTLKFQIWLESQKLDPEQWIGKF